MNKLRVFTTFSGYDSQCLALDRLGIDYELVGWSEIDRYAIQAHNALYPQWADRNYGDITKIDWEQVPDFDLFTYSSPCQDFSQAGLQRGGEQGSGTRSSLLWECERAIAAKRPKYLLMENVSALVSQKFIKLFNRWQVVLQGYGYRNFAKVLNAKDYGVPQNRERIFLVSIREDGESPRYEFPQKEKLTRRLKDVLETEVEERYYLNDERVRGLLLSTQKEKDAGRGFAFEPKTGDDTANSVTCNAGSRKTDNFIQVVGDLQPDNRRPKSRVTRQQNYVIGADGGSMAITAEHARLPFKIAEPQVIGSTQKNAFVGSTEGVSPIINAACGMGGGQTPMVSVHPLSHKAEFRGFDDEKSPALRATDYKAPVCATDGFRIRKLTPRECFRLMDVSESDIDKIQEAGISNSQQYKLAGNSIVVACLYHIFRKLFVDTQQENNQLKLF